MAGELRHAHRRQGVVHPAANFRRGDTQILRGKGHILLHHVGHDLIVGILEHHTHPAADLQQKVLVLGVHALYIYRAAGGKQHGVEMLGKGGFAGTVVAQHHHKAALFDGQGHILQGCGPTLALLHRVGEGECIGSDHCLHWLSLFCDIFTCSSSGPWRRRAAPCRNPCTAGPARPR